LWRNILSSAAPPSFPPFVLVFSESFVKYAA
jgi:hypothetical protein